MIFLTPELDETDQRVLDEIGKIRTSIKFALRAPTSIEGYEVSAEDALAVVEGENPLDAQSEAWLAVKGYRDAMTYVLQLANDPHFSYSDGLLKSFHFMMVQHELKKHPGVWRPGAIYVRDEQKGVVVYEGPDAEMIPCLIDELIIGLNKDNSTPALIRAAMAHLNFVMIHPFSDGNGRMSRCLQTLVLGREGILEPEFCSIEEYLGRNTQAYYDILAAVGRGHWQPRNDARPWIRFCLTAHYRQGKTIARRIEETRRISDEIETMVQKYQLPERCILGLVDAAMGYRIRNSTYRSIADISENLASRDLKTLVEQGLLSAAGETRGRVYVATSMLLEIRKRNRQPRVLEDPFDSNLDQSLLPGLVSA